MNKKICVTCGSPLIRITLQQPNTIQAYQCGHCEDKTITASFTDWFDYEEDDIYGEDDNFDFK